MKPQMTNFWKFAFLGVTVGLLVSCGSVGNESQSAEESVAEADETATSVDVAAPLETDQALPFSDECLAVMVSATEVSEYEDTWEDIFPAFEQCDSLEALVAAADEAKQDDRFDALIENPALVLSNLCDPANYPDGPHSTGLCSNVNS